MVPSTFSRLKAARCLPVVLAALIFAGCGTHTPDQSTAYMQGTAQADSAFYLQQMQQSSDDTRINWQLLAIRALVKEGKTGQAVELFNQLPQELNDSQRREKTLLAKLQEGQNIALVSDAGTPLINDPGYHLVRTCREAGICVVPLPGPCAAITALSAAGLPSDRFCYEGFLPAKSKGRRDALKAIEAEPRTLIFYESTHRLLDSLEDIVAVLGESRYVVLARELTKTWETIHGAPVGELLAWVKEDENRRKGEMVLIIEGHKAQEEDLPADALRTLALLQAELPLKKAAALAAEIHGVKKNALYKYALEQQG